jgi:NitT/TauT family transport system ATP-binding protein
MNGRRMQSAIALQFIEASRRFGSVEVFRKLSLEVLNGEFVAIVGPSGCGKTTLLNIASGYDRPDSGTVEREGGVRMVFQQSGLFPWRTVEQNIALGLRSVRDKEQLSTQLADLLRLIQLEGFEHHYPHQLSGGMKQRVELARALAGESDLLLMDEPFSALDYLTRLRMRQELARILQQRPRTVLLVTHDIEEAAQLADRVLVLSERPAEVRVEICIAATRPRDPTHPEVVNATRRILDVLGLDAEAIGQRTDSL